MNLCKKIQELRLSKGMSQKDLGIAINKAESSVKKYESGHTGITVELLHDISNALDVTPISLILDSYDDIFSLFINQKNLHRLDTKELATLEIEFKFILDYLSYKYDNTK